MNKYGFGAFTYNTSTHPKSQTMKYLFSLLIISSFLSCTDHIDSPAELWITSPITIDNITGCKISAYKGEQFDGIIPTSIGGVKVLEIGSGINSQSILPNPQDTSIHTLDFSKAHHLHTIGSNAFYGNKHIKSIILNKTLKSIEYGAFADCKGLSEIGWNKDLRKIGEGAFYNCDNLESVIIPNKVDSIIAFAFYSCSGLKEVKFSDKLTHIGERAFANATKIEALNFPKHLTFIGTKAFLNCAKVKSLTLPSSLIEINDKAFFRCSGLTTLTIENTSGIKIGKDTFSATPLQTSQEAIVHYPKSAIYPEMEHWKSLDVRWMAE